MRTTLTLPLFFLTTVLLAQEPLPYTTGFEGAEGTLNTNFPAGWTWEDLNTVDLGNQEWQIIKNSETVESARTDSTAAHMFSHPSQDNDDWLYTPAFEAVAGATYTLTFWYSTSPLLPSTEKLAVHAGAEASHTAMGEALWSDQTITNTAYQQATVNYTAAMSGLFHFGFHCTSEPFQFILLIDDIAVQASNVGVDELGPTAVRSWVSGDLLFRDLPIGVQGVSTRILDASGRVVLQHRAPGNGPVEVTTLSQGTYTALYTSGTRLYRSRFVIAR